MMTEVTSSEDELIGVDPKVAFADACRSIHPRLVGALALRTGDRQLAEDLAQEALARLWRDWPKVKAGGAVEPWVFATAFNLLRSWHRRLRVARRHPPLLAAAAHTAHPTAALAVPGPARSLPAPR